MTALILFGSSFALVVLLVYGDGLRLARLRLAHAWNTHQNQKRRTIEFIRARSTGK